MAIFLDCLCDHNLKGLCREGEPEPALLNEAWIAILLEYQSLRGYDVRDPTRDMLQRDIIRTHNHLVLVNACVKMLRVAYSEKIAQQLRLLGYPFKPSSDIPANYEGLLVNIISKSKYRFIVLQQLTKEMQQLIEKEMKNHKEVKRENFEKLLLEFEQLMGIQYDMETITVKKFCQLEEKYWARIGQIKNNSKK